MSKPQSGADSKLINSGLKLAKEKGLTGFSVRELCSKAKVNPGLFHYYFTSRENFNRAVLTELYKTLLKELEINIPQNLSSIDKLVAFRALLTQFTVNNASLLASIIIDIFSGNEEIFSFIKENFTYHIRLALSIVDECKKDGVVEDTDSLDMLISFVLPVIVPNIAVSVLTKVLDKKAFKQLKPILNKLLSDLSIKERSRLSLKAVMK